MRDEGETWYRRMRWYWVGMDTVWGLLRARWQVRDVEMTFYWRDGVPDDAILLKVRYDPMRMGFGFLMAHASFDLVADGAEIPPAGGLHYEAVRIDRGRDGEAAVRAYESLRQENLLLRKVLSDMTQDEERIAAASKLGYSEGWSDGRKALTMENIHTI